MSRRVIVAVEAADVRDAALRVVRELGLEAVGVGDGHSARALCEASAAPVALVLDVGLPGPHSFQLVDELRARSAKIAVILVASVYSRTAYKRRPESLHGADDYVEQHHVPDQLGGKLRALVPGVIRIEPTGLAGEAQRIRRAGEGRLAFRYDDRGEAEARALRLAEVVVADVILYAGAAADAATSRTELERLLGPDLAAARELIGLRVPAEIADPDQLVVRALDALLAARAAAKPSKLETSVP